MPHQAGCIRSSQKVSVSGNALPGGSYMLTVKYISTKRSHFIFEKGTGNLIDVAIGVKPAEE